MSGSLNTIFFYTFLDVVEPFSRLSRFKSGTGNDFFGLENIVVVEGCANFVGQCCDLSLLSLLLSVISAPSVGMASLRNL